MSGGRPMFWHPHRLNTVAHMFKAGKSDAEIGAFLGRSVHSIADARATLNLSRNRTKPPVVAVDHRAKILLALDAMERAPANRKRSLVVRDAIAQAYNMPPEVLCGYRRDAQIVEPRMIGMILARQMMAGSIGQIGRVFNRHHSTVVHASRHARLRPLVDSVLAGRAA